MDRASWRTRTGPPKVLLIAALIVTAAPAAVAPAAFAPEVFAALRPAPPRAALCPSIDARAAASAAQRAPRGRIPTLAVEALFSARGELNGRQVRLQTAGGGSVVVALPVESSVGPIIGSLVVYTKHTRAAGSEVRAIDVQTGCDVRLAAPPEIVRSALLDPAARALYIHRVSRAGRQDLGVSRFDFDSGESKTVVPPFPVSDDVGPTFGTQLVWSTGGDALAVHSCGFSRCRTRVLNTGDGSVETHDATGQGQIVALDGQHLVTFADCPGRPCALLATDRATAEVKTLAEEAFAATVASTAGERLILNVETAAGNVEVTP